MEGLQIAFSPCPNDTYLFHAWACGLIDCDPHILPVFKDVELLNQEAMRGTYPVTKLSFFALSQLPEYELLRVGATLGFGCGPKVIAKKPIKMDELKRLRLGIPGALTTAHLLTQLFLEKPKTKQFCTYDEIFTLLHEDKIDAGVIIHEQRFSFKESQFYEVVDLGALWEAKTNLPLPLGCIAAKKSLGPQNIATITKMLRKSLEYAKERPEASTSYVLEHAQVKDPKIVRQHIDLYVTEETFSLSQKGKEAIKLILKLGSRGIHKVPHYLEGRADA